jgi:prepilin-type N-terminal cleavage/methylation domain-containing protein
MHSRRAPAFTLIELLIVVAIIAILAAIAVPNFIEAQVRAKVSRTMEDLRVSGGALAMYRVDYNAFPHSFSATVLTTPVAYVQSISFKDPFGTKRAVITSELEVTYGYANMRDEFVQSFTRTYALKGCKALKLLRLRIFSVEPFQMLISLNLRAILRKSSLPHPSFPMPNRRPRLTPWNGCCWGAGPTRTWKAKTPPPATR